MSQSKAFSLIEIMVVVGIISLLAAFAIPSYRKSQCKADWAEVQSCISDISLRLDNYRSNHGLYPEPGDPLVAVGLPSDYECGKHYDAEVEISATRTGYKVTVADTFKKINCSTDPGDDEWVMIQSSPKVYHTKNPVDGAVDTLPTWP